MKSCDIAGAAVGLLLCSLCATAAGQAQPPLGDGPSSLDCFKTPSSSNCSTFVVPDAAVEADLQSICPSVGETPTGWPTGCALWAECRAGRGGTQLCRPLRLALTACSQQAVPTRECEK